MLGDRVSGVPIPGGRIVAGQVTTERIIAGTVTVETLRGRYLPGSTLSHVTRVDGRPEEEREQDSIAGGDDLRVDDLPSVHLFGELGDAPEEVDCGASDGSDWSGDGGDGLVEGDDPVLGHD